MKTSLILLLSLVMLGCTKQKLEKFNNRIVGNWQLTEINTFGLGSSNIVFNSGSFSFKSDHTATYYDRNQNTYYGNWYIDPYITTDSDGNSETDFILSIDVRSDENFKADQFEIPSFGNANRFKARVTNNFNVVTYVFVRQ